MQIIRINPEHKPAVGVSVIIPFYRELDYLERVLASVSANVGEDTDHEVLLCNDGDLSEAQIRDAAKLYDSDLLTVHQNEFEKGPGGARNTGLRYARYSLVAFLDADDLWMSGKLDKQIECYKKGATFIATDYALDTGKKITAPAAIRAPVDIFLRRGLGTSTILVCRRLIGETRFRSIRFGQDIDFWYRLSQNSNFKYAKVAETTVTYSTSGSTTNKFVQLQYMLKVLQLNNVSLIIVLRFILSYVSNGLWNHYVTRYYASMKFFFRKWSLGRR